MLFKDVLDKNSLSYTSENKIKNNKKTDTNDSRSWDQD
jgi:hypothetical protein